MPHRHPLTLPRAALLLALACTATLTLAEAPRGAGAYTGRTVCCTDPSAFRYVALPARGTVEFDIDRHSPLFEFQSGLSTFAAFRLPNLKDRYLVEIRSYLRGGPDPLRAHVYYPAVAVMSDDFLVTNTLGPEALVPDLPIQERTTQPAYRLILPIDPARGHESYVVVFTPEGLLARDRAPASVEGPEAAERAAAGAYLGASAEGHLSITIITLDEGSGPAGP